MKRITKHLFSFLLLAGFIFIAFGSGDDESELNNDVNSELLEEPNNNVDIKLTDDKFIEQLERVIVSIDKNLDFSTYRGEIQSIQMEIVLFGAWSKTINEALDSNNDKIKKLGSDLKNKVKKIQVKEFPILRKAYKDAIYQKLWVENIETSISGKGNKTIQFTGGIFANNKNKQETQNTLSEILTQLRFKKVNYKWYEYDDEYTYYEMDTPNDDELVTFN